MKIIMIQKKYYYYIINNDSSLEDINNELENINIIRSTVTYPFLLALFDDYYRNRIISSNELLEVLKIIVSYIYRRNMCGIATNALNNIFAVMPREVKKRNSKNFTYGESIVDFLMSRTGSGIFPRNNEFENNFINANMYAIVSSLTKFILYQIEEFKHKEVVKIDKLSVEHVLPQELTHEWNLELGTNAYETHNTYKDSIGNLTSTNYNSKMSNKSFSEKKNFY